MIRADRVGEATTTGRITRYIQRALERRAEIGGLSQQLADKRLGITPASAAAVLAATHDWRRMVSVCMVDYSCTVKPGTSIAIKSAMYRAAKQGCLIKSGQSRQALAGVDTLVFDKTGTLTHDSLQVTVIVPLARGVDEERAVAMVALLGEHGAHPIARAVVGLAQARQLAHVVHEEANFILGQGVEGRIGGNMIRFGSRHFLEDDEHVSFAAGRARVEALKAEGGAMLYAAQHDHPLAMCAPRGRLRDEVAPVLARLRRMGIRRMVMIPGDGREKALAFGGALRMGEVDYEQQPEGKTELVAALKAQGARLAYVGDG